MHKSSILSLGLLAALATAGTAQQASVADDGSIVVSSASQPGPTPQVPGSLTTLFASNNQFAGNMVDITTSVDLTLTSIDINVSEVGGTATIELWYRNGTSVGFETDPLGDWVQIGTTWDSAAGGTMGTDLPTNVDLSGNGYTFTNGNLTGFYVNLISYLGGIQVLRYTNGTNVYSNADMSLTTHAGKGTPGFSGSTFSPRELNATLNYETGGGGGFTISTLDTCPGPMTFSISGASPGAQLAIVRANGLGTTTVGAPCGTVTLGLSSAGLALVTVVVADGSGNASLSAGAPSIACGLISAQVVDLSNCATSNTISL